LLVPELQWEAWEKDPDMHVVKVLCRWIEAYPPSLEHEAPSPKIPELIHDENSILRVLKNEA